MQGCCEDKWISTSYSEVMHGTKEKKENSVSPVGFEQYAIRKAKAIEQCEENNKILNGF